jgi:methylmalonyl-CoA mutase
MTRIPDFAKVDFAQSKVAAAPAAGGEPWLTPEGIPVKSVYGANDLSGIDFLDTYPGIAPYLRGPYPAMYVNQPWTIRQYAGFSTAEDSNAFYRRNLAAGQKGLSVAFDLATHRGYDSDHPRVSGDVGMAGVAIDSIYDMRTLFSGIPLDRMTVSMTMNGAVLPVLALYVVAAEEQGVKPAQLGGTIQNDILKEFMVRNTYIYPPAPSLRIISDIFAYTSQNMPKFNSISISGYHMQEAGATQDLELAYTLADGIEYVRAGIKAGIPIDQFAPAALLLLGDRHEFLHGSRQDACRAAFVGEADEGVQSEGCARALAAHALPDLGLVARRAGRVQQRAAHHGRGDGSDAGTHAIAAYQRARRGARAADRFLRPHRPQYPNCPAAGKRHHPHHRSVGWLLLCRTADLRACQESLGSHPGSRGTRRMAKAIEASIPKLRIEEAAAKTQARIDAGVQSVIGVNKYKPKIEAAIDVLKVDNSAVRTLQIDKLARLKKERDPKKLQAALDALTSGASSGGNLLALAIAAARAKATVGEISSALEKVFGRHRAEIKAISGVYKREVGTMSDTVERVQKLVSEFETNEGRRPRYPGRQDRQDGHDRGQKVIASRVRRSRLRRRYRAALCTSAGSRAASDRERRAYRRRLLARGRASHRGSRTQSRTRKAGPARHHDRDRRRGAAAGLRCGEESRCRGDLPARAP